MQHTSSPWWKSPQDPIYGRFKITYLVIMSEILGFDLSEVRKKGNPEFVIICIVSAVQARLRHMLGLIQKIHIGTKVISAYVKITSKN